MKIGAGVAPAAGGPPLDQIPDDLLTPIVDLLGTLADLARLSQTCRRLRRICRAPYLIQKLSYSPDLLPPFIPDTQLPAIIRELARLLHQSPLTRRYTTALTPQVAAGVYDQIGRSRALSTATKVELTRLLIRDVARDVFAAVVLAPDFDLAAIDVVLGLPEDVRGAEVPPGVPPWMVEAVHDFLRTDAARFADPKGYADDVLARVRSRYPAPFDRVFPHNFAMSEHLAWQLAERRVVLDDAGVVLALLRVGIRIGLLDFAHNVEFPADLVPVLFPLLCCPHPPSMFGLVEMLVTSGRVGHVAVRG